METTVRATFMSMTNMQKAAEALKRQGVIDLRIDGNSGSTLPDDVEFALETLISGASAQETPALWVSVEKSRFRQAEDTITAYGGAIEPSITIFE